MRRDHLEGVPPGVQFVSRPILVAGVVGLWSHRYTGLPGDLIDAGLLKPEQLPAAAGSSTAFTPTGVPVPPGAVNAWAEPGHVMIRRAAHNRIVVTRTVREEPALSPREEAERAESCWPFPAVFGTSCLGAPAALGERELR